MAGLYIHIPFCRSKCSYCDFVSFAGCQDKQNEYIDALLKELENISPLKTVNTVFIGGGTPSFLSVPNLERLLNSINKKFNSSLMKEFTIEANPCDLNKEKLQIFKDQGVNRLSVGLQSANENELKMLGRVHDFNRFYEGYQNTREVGFANINIDLISGLPLQTLQSWEQTLGSVINLNPEHISCYSLILDENTPIYSKIQNKILPIPDEETDRLIYAQTKIILADAGYRRYEISNYAKEGFECLHNMNYWLSGEYIGLGVAASSYIDGCRSTHTSDIDEYCRCIWENKSPAVLKETLSEKDQRFEAVMLQLRLINGLDRSAFKKKFGQDIMLFYPEIIEKFIKIGLLELTTKTLKLTEKGLDLADSVIIEFLE